MDAADLSKVFADSVLPVTVFFGILGVFGIVGNACVLYVYKCKYPPCNFRTFVIYLAATDFISCLFVFPCEIAGHRIWFSYPESAAWFCKFKTHVYGITVLTSALILLLISVDRFRKVCRPFNWQIRPKVAQCLCFATFGVAVVMTIPVPILFGIQTQNITYMGETVSISSCQKDNKYKHTKWMTVYVFSMYYTPVISFMITTTVLYGMILRKIFSKKVLTWLNATSGTAKHRRSVKADDSSLDKAKPSVLSSDTFHDITSTFDTNDSGDNIDRAEETTETVANPFCNEEKIFSLQETEAHSIDTVKMDMEQENAVKDDDENAAAISNDVKSEKNDYGIGKIVEDKPTTRTRSQQRITRKTVIMLIVTLIFNVTMLIYFSALFVIVQKQHIFELVNTDTAAILFLSWRIYFVNHVINPVIYGLLDKRFREALQNSTGRV